MAGVCCWNRPSVGPESRPQRCVGGLWGWDLCVEQSWSGASLLGQLPPDGLGCPRRPRLGACGQGVYGGWAWGHPRGLGQAEGQLQRTWPWWGG